ncbi:MAG TPA: hypothetical protein VJ724_01465 [Tahibacter sp.]|nr:hypothetical protein [Tahibacter sp.]
MAKVAATVVLAMAAISRVWANGLFGLINNDNVRHSSEGWNPAFDFWRQKSWIPAFAG